MPLNDTRGQGSSYSPSINNGGVTGTSKNLGLGDTLLHLIDPSDIRKKITGLFDGGVASLINKANPPTVNLNTPGTITAPDGDWRVRIGLSDWSIFPNNQMFTPVLSQTAGVIFPYTPTVSVTHNARYQEQALTHSNYKNYFYEGSDVSAITISGEFTVQNHNEAVYLLSAIYFFRTCTKMFFGKDTLAGNPPPVVRLNGYGSFYFPDVTCVITSFQHNMPADVDYVEFYYSDGPGQANGDGSISTAKNQVARLPTTSTISVTLQPIYSRQNVHQNMTLSKFSQGKLLAGNGGFL
jgi:hypothetical protein